MFPEDFLLIGIFWVQVRDRIRNIRENKRYQPRSLCVCVCVWGGGGGGGGGRGVVFLCVSKNYRSLRSLTGDEIFRYLKPFPHTITPSDAPWETGLFLKKKKKKLWEKEKLLVTSNFSFQTVFSTRLDNFLPFSSNLKLSSANSFNLEASKICRLVMGIFCTSWDHST